ncbi:MAG: FKBP-type peptidyl-prolyl cis-trans isomerase FklB (EC [uncultured Thiotrichaceae bacterium]|uniref:Peptidyl-prolyl cis-trans isomerase n=1 Tax=uncultured Thiotrichaceae bacterium TaxID=298394 RepID=A0A6S6S5S5_9GAMM|nr:MAG: FKBP-type peptidyl-prolyl cis-trans isomerase FklB (EC [uncultured Thiotrichaceae bacterium]
MKLITPALGFAAMAFMSTAVAAPLETLEQRLSYILGQNAAAQMGELEFSLDLEAFKLALEEAAMGDDKKPSLSQEDIMKTIQEARKIGAEAAQKKAAALSEANTKIGAEYIAANAKKEGVVVTESGLQYKEITAGKGDMPKATDKVKVHYKGTLIDGTVFDSSYDRGEPATFPVTGVIKGWIEALQLMNVGDKFQLTIPPELAYGAKGTGSDIGPNATLLFDVELIEIMK